jgi:chemotaxis protein histidine kinase CheA
MDDASRTLPLAGVDEQMRAEHHHIHKLDRQLQEAAELPDLLIRLAELRAFLPAHFLSEEEAGGFFDVVRSTTPRHAAHVDVLEREHHTLLADIDALAGRATICLGEVAAVLKDARALGRRLIEHEAAEDHMLMDAMCTDLGQSE